MPAYSSPTPPHFQPFSRCDAEPGALAEYILALLKHNVSENDMRKELNSQLDEFLEKGPSQPFSGQQHLIATFYHRMRTLHRHIIQSPQDKIISAVYLRLNSRKAPGRGHSHPTGWTSVAYHPNLAAESKTKFRGRFRWTASFQRAPSKRGGQFCALRSYTKYARSPSMDQRPRLRHERSSQRQWNALHDEWQTTSGVSAPRNEAGNMSRLP